MTILAIDWSTTGIKAAQFVLSFSILVVLHELGHFLPARWFKCRVEKFYLFFNPWFSLYKKKIGDTEYGLGWIPFGGYVKIAGMIDESMDKEQLKLPPQPDEFRAKKAWQRLIIMIGGVIVNIILAIIIFIGIMWYWGEKSLPGKSVTYGIYADSLGKQMGIQDGDKIIKTGKKELTNIIALTREIILSEPKTVTVIRNNQVIELPIPIDIFNGLNKLKGEQFVYIRTPQIVEDFLPNSNAKKAGILKGDRIVGVDSLTTLYLHEFKKYVKDKQNTLITVKIVRNNTDTLSFPIMLNEKGLIGIVPVSNLSKLGFNVENKTYTFFEAIPAGYTMCWNTLSNYLTGLKQLFTGKVKASDSVGSVISIGSLFPGEWDWQSFWTLTAIFSIILAFMNILPIPALDGGHALFTIIEMVTGRKPSDKFMEYAQTVGMVLLLSLMAYALGLDFFRLFNK